MVIHSPKGIKIKILMNIDVLEKHPGLGSTGLFNDKNIKD